MESRVFGGPGTGKTSYTARQVAHAARTYGSDQVLVASLTKAAARELLQRRLPIDETMVGTLHSLCFRALGCPPIAETLLKDWNAAERRYRLKPSTWNIDDAPVDAERTAPGDELAQQYHLLRARLVLAERWPLRVKAFAQAWEDFKRQTGAIDFTDMIELVYHDFDGAPGNPAVAFIDEAQDLNVLELALVRKWESRLETLVLVGDEDQSLYTFRGADVELFLTPLPAEQKRVLTQSWRLPRAILTYAQRWIERVARRAPKLYAPRDADGEVRRLPGATIRWPEGLLGDLEHTLAQDKSVMIVVTCSYQLRRVLACLRRNGIAYHNPYRLRQRSWNPSAPDLNHPRVIVGTIHSVKGGEADVVYVFPDLSAQGMRAWLSGDPAHHDSVIRQFYVAFTRARETLVLCGQASPKAVRFP